MQEIKNVMLWEPADKCPKEIIYTHNELPNFYSPFRDVKNSRIEQVDVCLPVLMKDGSIGKVTLDNWVIRCHFEGMDWYGNLCLTEGGLPIPDSHTEIWCNEESNSGQYIYAKPSFPVQAVCVDRNYNRDGLYLFLQEI